MKKSYSFGICESCGTDIGDGRILTNAPRSLLCVDCALFWRIGQASRDYAWLNDDLVRYKKGLLEYIYQSLIEDPDIQRRRRAEKREFKAVFSEEVGKILKETEPK